jgi:pimeloyl-ACP methyl ester carboxylesterase
VPHEFARQFQASTAYAPLPESFFKRIVSESLKLPARLWPEVLGAVIKYDDVDQLAGIRAPTYLMWGDRDALFPREDQDRLAAAIPGIERRIYQEIGHCPNWECPEAVAEDLLAFISKR